MAEIEPLVDDDFQDEVPTEGETRLRRSELERRCRIASIDFEEVDPFEEGEPAARIALPRGREKRWVYCWDFADFESLLSIDFEKFTFISDLDAVCNYEKSEIEALIRPLGSISPRIAFARLFGIQQHNFNDEWSQACVELEAPVGNPKTTVAISPLTAELSALIRNRGMFSLKIQRDGIAQHDQALSILKSISDALFFQIDLISGIPLSLGRDRRASVRPRARKSRETSQEIVYPRTEFDSAPISLYWYARSAVGMPLLQFLAYYQVIEFYYPTYSQAEARRRLKVILKDPTFRGDRDSDLGRLLSSIQITRSGGFGDERSQLKATLSECVDPDDLKAFLTEDKERAEFFSSKAKGLTDQKLPLASQGADLRSDVAERIYDIRCKIVHTKTDSRTGELELLLPFSKEAEQLQFDIELVQYVAQKVLVAASAVK